MMRTTLWTAIVLAVMLGGKPGQAQTPPTTAADYNTSASAAASAQKPRRGQLIGSKTEVRVSPEATKDSAYLTPLPIEAPDKAAHLPGAISLKLPFEGTWTVSTGYGYESGSWTHQTLGNQASANDFFALDFNMPIGVPILAPADGRVVTSQDRSTSDSYGNYIVIDHGNGIHSVYAHLNTRVFDVDHGVPEVFVKQGQRIGTSGASGGMRVPHLHFGVHLDARLSHSGCDVGGKTVVPEPISGYYGLRRGHVLVSDNQEKKEPAE
jgi:murein DD-endopeptidase MepM/ murein hydrolase activator NlpD